ncbi:MAG TPA: alkaline phosphatase family protein [Dongiaceae bacterium]|nr:alkaline phosphatase family protein [Dongiaceae bacterium]
MSMDGAVTARERAGAGKADPVVIIGLDAMDCDTALAFAAEGIMPVLESLLARMPSCPLLSPPGLFVSALWANFATGLRPDRHRFLCWDEVDVATYRRRLTTPETMRGTPFWRRLAAAGHASASIDVPHTILRDFGNAANGQALEIAEWACHDRHLGLQVWPPAEQKALLAAFGRHPLFGMEGIEPRHYAPDDYLFRAGAHRTPDEMKQLTAAMLEYLPLKTRLLQKYLAARRWDLFIGVYGEAHCAGHQLWHLHDTGHPRFDPAIQRHIGGDPIRRIYAGLDEELGRLLETVDPDATLLLMLSHGMTSHHDGTHLLEEVLRRIELAGASLGEAVAHRLRSAGDAVARSALGLIRPIPKRDLARPAERASRRFFLSPNNTVYGGVRLNLIGREPNGRVSPEEVDGLLTSLERDLLALVNTRTGRPAIRGVSRAERWYRRDRTDTMPDLFVDWDHTHPIESVRSDKVGLVEMAYEHWRTGDHRDHGLMLASGPGIAKGASLPALAMEDIAASILARFGEDVSDLDGRPVPWLADARVPA